MDGPLRRFGRGERAKRRVRPGRRDLLIPAHAAAACVVQLEVPASAHHLGMPQDRSLSGRYWAALNFAAWASGSMAIAEGCQTPCVFPSWLGPGVGR
jgi:hypothetical protein